jgi:hypothetical protein
MKRLLVMAVLVVTALGFSVTTGVAASTSKVTVAAYTVAYPDPFFGAVTCTGIHKSGGHYGTGGQDSFTCTSTTGLPLTNVTPGEKLTLASLPSSTWLSDYNGASAISFSGTVSSDMFSYTAVATYP